MARLNLESDTQPFSVIISKHVQSRSSGGSNSEAACAAGKTRQLVCSVLAYIGPYIYMYVYIGRHIWQILLQATDTHILSQVCGAHFSGRPRGPLSSVLSRRQDNSGGIGQPDCAWDAPWA